MFPPNDPDQPPAPRHHADVPQPRYPVGHNRHAPKPQRQIIIPATAPKRRIFSRYLPVIACMAMIYVASTSLGRPENSHKLFDPVLTFLGFKDIDNLHVYVRKLGHVAEYTLLTLALAYFFLTSSRETLRRWWFPIALACVFVYASIDEFHQLFVPERVGSIRDVMIDTASGLVILSLVAAARRLFIRRTAL